MADNIINKEHVEAHTVQRYRFKVLGSSVSDLQASSAMEEGLSKDPFESTDEVALINEIPKVLRAEESSQHLFVEELLKKTDELTTNVIKLQLQIERQEGEFNQRLNEELKRERENAHTQGYQKAKEELEGVLSEVKSRYLKSINQLETLSVNIEEKLLKIESEMSATAFEIAKEVIKKEVTLESGQIAVLLSKELLKELKDASKIELKVNPKDLEMLKELYANNEKIKVSADDAITLGGVVLLSDAGNLDGSLAMRLEKVKYLIQEN